MLGRYLKEIMLYLSVIVGILALYAICGYYFFLNNSSFVNFGRAFNTCFQIINFNYDYQKLNETDQSLGIVPPLYYFSLIIICYFLLLNVFLAVVLGAHDESISTRDEVEELFRKGISERVWRKFMMPYWWWGFHPTEQDLIDELCDSGLVKQKTLTSKEAHVYAKGCHVWVTFYYSQSMDCNDPACSKKRNSSGMHCNCSTLQLWPI